MRSLSFVIFIFIAAVVCLRQFQDQIHNHFSTLGARINLLLTKDNYNDDKDTKALLTENYLLKEALHGLMEEMQFSQEREEALLAKMKRMPARVIFREPASWGSYFWIDKGHKNSDEVLKIFSPVVAGQNLVGMVDFVSEYKSRVRLITHSKLSIAIEVGQEPHKIRGEISGGSKPLWRSTLLALQGTLFTPKQSEEVSLDDFLTTSGFDGIFPRGLQVGRLKSIKQAEEGGIAAQFEAEPLIPNLIEIEYVQVLPAIKSSRDYNDLLS